MPGGWIAAVDVLPAFHDEVKNLAVTTTVVINDLTGSDSNQAIDSVQLVRAGLPVAWVTALAGDLSVSPTDISLCPSSRSLSWKYGRNQNKSLQKNLNITIYFLKSSDKNFGTFVKRVHNE